jgi:ABC-type uncharacterized transport system permease subunit
VNTALHALAVLLPTAYLLAAFLHGMAFGGPRALRVAAPRRAVLVSTIAVHALTFVLRAQALGHFPVNDVWSTLSAVALGAAALQTWISRASRPATPNGEVPSHAGTGGVVLGLVFVLQLIASAFAPIDVVPRAEGMGAFQILHVATSVLAAAALVLSGVHGILYLVLFREMRERRFGALFAHLPNLDVLARMTRSAALSGFLFLTIGLNVGIAIAHAEASPGFRYGTPEVLLSLVLWVHFGVIAFSRYIRGFSARRASFAAAGGLVALLLSLVLILFPGVSFHSGV